MRQRIQKVQESILGQSSELVGLDENSSGILQIISQTLSFQEESDQRPPMGHLSEQEGPDEDLFIENSENQPLDSCKNIKLASSIHESSSVRKVFKITKKNNSPKQKYLNAIPFKQSQNYKRARTTQKTDGVKPQIIDIQTQLTRESDSRNRALANLFIKKSSFALPVMKAST